MRKSTARVERVLESTFGSGSRGLGGKVDVVYDGGRGE